MIFDIEIIIFISSSCYIQHNEEKSNNFVQAMREVIFVLHAEKKRKNNPNKIENVRGKETKSMNLCHSNENIILRSFPAAPASGIV